MAGMGYKEPSQEGGAWAWAMSKTVFRFQAEALPAGVHGVAFLVAVYPIKPWGVVVWGSGLWVLIGTFLVDMCKSTNQF